MPYTISKTHTFSASHVLTGLRDGHPCGRLHGHNYTIRLHATAAGLNEVGFVIDYNDLAPFFQFVDDRLDHRHINECMDGNPTAERISRWLTIAAEQLLPAGAAYTVDVSETGKTWATWTR